MKTIGDVRQQIEVERATWVADTDLPGSTLIPRRPTGATPSVPLSTAPLDVRALAGKTTSNHYLALRRSAVPSGEQVAIPAHLIRVNTAQPGLTPADGDPNRPSVVDWRSRFNDAWLCAIQNQDPCDSCWAFTTAAMIEAAVKIEHHLWSKRSEGDVRDGSAFGDFLKSLCANSWNAEAALGWTAQNGICDYGAWPTYYDSNHGYSPTPDRGARTAINDPVTGLATIEDQKHWLDLVGPITCSIQIYDSFYVYKSGVWRRLAADTTANPENHQCVVVGYDDVQGAWLLRNSWGIDWGMAGYCYMAYGEANIDQDGKVGINNVKPDPWSRRRMQSGCMLESDNGASHKDFEIVLNWLGSSLLYLTRGSGDNGDFKWSANPATEHIPGPTNSCQQNPTLICSTFARNFEGVYWSKPIGAPAALRHFYLDRATSIWKDDGPFGPPDVAGYPGLIQSSVGAPGNFELVVRTDDGRLAHWWRSSLSFQWQYGSHFGTNILQSGPSFIESSYNTGVSPGHYPIGSERPGTFQVVAVLTSGQLQRFELDHTTPDPKWAPCETFAGGFGDTSPCMIETNYSTTDETVTGNFEVCIATPHGTIQHWWRDNLGDQQWRIGSEFGQNVKSVTAIIQDSWNNLNVVAQIDLGYFLYWRDNSGNWQQAPTWVQPGY